MVANVAEADAVAEDVASAILALNRPRGVEELTASAVLGHINAVPVILVGQEASKNALAANAGFIKFCPIPPKTCFTMMMAKAAPTTASHHGAVTGKLKASRIPVTTALQSLIVIGFLVSFCTSASARTEVNTEMIVNNKALMPKK